MPAAGYRLETPRPRPPPPPQLRHPSPSTSVHVNTQCDQTPPPASPTFQSSLEKFTDYCRSWYFDQDEVAGRAMTETLSSVAPSQLAPYSRLQASVRSAYHASVNARRDAEFQAHVCATRPGGSLTPYSRADPNGPIARKERLERFERFLRSWCTVGMPGTKPFFGALWAVMQLQVLPKRSGGAGHNKIQWEVDDAMFKEAAGKYFMLEAIDVLKGVLGFEEAPSSDVNCHSYDSNPPSSLRQNRSDQLSMPSTSRSPEPSLISMVTRSRRARAPSDPFLNMPAISHAVPSAASQSPSATLPQSSCVAEGADDSALTHDPDAKEELQSASLRSAWDDVDLRIWTTPDLLNSEYLSLLTLFPSFITRGSLPRFPVLSRPRAAHIEEGEQERETGKEIHYGTGSIWVSAKQRRDGVRSGSLATLANRVFSRYDQPGVVQNLEEPIVFDREAPSLRQPGRPDHYRSLINSATQLFTRYKQLNALQDLEEAIVLSREALLLCPPGHPDRFECLSKLAVLLSTRYEHLGALQDLEAAIVFSREALSLRPPGHPDRSASLTYLANHLSTHFGQLGILQDLEDAIVLDREALSLLLQGHPDRSKSLSNLAVLLSTRYERLGALQDLKEAIVLNREAFSLRPPGHTDRSVSLNNLAADLSTLYDRLGVLQDLEEAIVLDREALSLLPPGHPDRSVSLNNLAADLSTRYKQLSALQDLEEAIALDQEVLSLRPPEHPNRSASLTNLASDLSARYDKCGVLQDLEKAIILDREALSLRPQGHPDRCQSLINLANRLSARYEQLGALGDLEEAISLDREALSLCPLGHPDRSSSLNDLADRLSIRYHQLGVLQDVEEAIVLDREALSLRPPGHPQRSGSLKNLVNHLSTRYHHFVSKQGLHDPSAASDLREVFVLYAPLAGISGAVSAADLDASRAWVYEAERFKHSSTLLAYETSLRFLVEHLSLLPTHPQHLVFLNKHSSIAMNAFSACLRHNAPQRAVELLEQGRGVFWNHFTRLHSPLDDVIASGPAGESLASEFTRLSSLIHKALDSSRVDQHEQLCRHNMEMQRVVAAIRCLPGYSRFLLPPLFSELRCAASAGPVIIVNASQYGCDALIIFADRDLVHVPLSITKQHVQHLSSTLRTMTPNEMSMTSGNTLDCILRELWDDVVFPIVRVLQTTYPLQGRIWWCPTAEFSTLPLHAASPCREGQQPLAALYISSYTPTLHALIHARRPRSSRPTRNIKRFVSIGRPRLGELPSELASVELCVNDAAMYTRIEDEECSIRRAAEQLGKNDWVHFACHGLANGHEPFRSAFSLSDGNLTIERIIRCDLDDPEFAYLSACHATVAGEESPDEMIHLASAMQFIGFRSVIGTMWAVDDEDETGKIISTFYRLMKDESGCLDHTRAAYALHETMRLIDAPIDQRVRYVHIGA